MRDTYYIIFGKRVSWLCLYDSLTAVNSAHNGQTEFFYNSWNLSFITVSFLYYMFFCVSWWLIRIFVQKLCARTIYYPGKLKWLCSHLTWIPISVPPRFADMTTLLEACETNSITMVRCIGELQLQLEHCSTSPRSTSMQPTLQLHISQNKIAIQVIQHVRNSGLLCIHYWI